MKLIIEDYAYKVTDSVINVLDGLCTLQDVDNKIAVSYVGYYYSPRMQDCVFILPKVLINEDGLVFGKYDPEKIIDVDSANLEPYELKFIYEFSVWIHRSIVVFNNTHPDNTIVNYRHIESEGHGARKKSNSLLDVLLSLIRFNKENRTFFTYVLKNIHSGYNKINWNKTIANTTAIIQDESPVYLRPINKKRQINFDEELIVIFFSILHYISEKYGFKTEIPFEFQLIKGGRFERYIKGLGCSRLRQIKNKYYSDIALRLWNLCYAFFDKTYQINTNPSLSEYLLVKSFNIVFEAIIDELIGDKDIPAGLKEQADGKLVDHFYTYDGLLINKDNGNDVYYIGDSKYYKIGSNPGKESVYKQYTYARNVIQWNLNVMLNPLDRTSEPNRYRNIELRDNLTEGYNIIPNFFISANIDPETLSYQDRTVPHPHQPPICRQFKNRLYDRDTLIVSHYDVNFLFIISLYARNNASDKAQWRSQVREKFRKEIQTILKDKFEFYAMTAHPDVNAQEYFKTHFQDTLGKTFRPFESGEVFSVALDNAPEFAEENAQLLSQLAANFYVVKCPLGEDPSESLEVNRKSIGFVDSPDGIHGNFITAVVTQDDKQYALFITHNANKYTMRRVPSCNLADIQYILPMISGKIDGYYKVNRISFGMSNDKPCLNFTIGDFYALGDHQVQIYRSKMQPGEILKYSDVLKLYNTIL
jgi:hypothetical protein